MIVAETEEGFRDLCRAHAPWTLREPDAAAKRRALADEIALAVVNSLRGLPRVYSGEFVMWSQRDYSSGRRHWQFACEAARRWLGARQQAPR